MQDGYEMNGKDRLKYRKTSSAVKSWKSKSRRFLIGVLVSLFCLAAFSPGVSVAGADDEVVVFFVGFEDHWRQVGIGEFIPDGELPENNDYWRPAVIFLKGETPEDITSIKFKSPAGNTVELDEDAGEGEWAKSVKHNETTFIGAEPAGFPIDPVGKFTVEVANESNGDTISFDWTGSDRDADFIVPAVKPEFFGPKGSFWEEQGGDVKHLVVNLASDDSLLWWNGKEFSNFLHEGGLDTEDRGRFDSVLIIVKEVGGEEIYRYEWPVDELEAEELELKEDEFLAVDLLDFLSVDLLDLDGEGLSVEAGKEYFVLVDYAVAMVTGEAPNEAPEGVVALQGFGRGFNTMINLEVINDEDRLDEADYDGTYTGGDSGSGSGSGSSSSSSSTCFIHTLSIEK